MTYDTLVFVRLATGIATLLIPAKIGSQFLGHFGFIHLNN